MPPAQGVLRPHVAVWDAQFELGKVGKVIVLVVVVVANVAPVFGKVDVLVVVVVC
jgi:hypothetical protein